MRLDGVDIHGIKLPRERDKVTLTSSKAKGLSLVVKAQTKEWHLRYTRLDGRRTSLKLGDWPDLDEAQAVAQAADQRALLRKGIDPVEHSRTRLRQAKADQFLAGQSVDRRYRLSALAAGFLADAEKRLRNSTVKKYRTAINVYLLPFAGGEDARFVDVHAFELELHRVSKRSAAAAANLLATTRAMFSYAVDTRVLTTNPLLGRKSLTRKHRVEPRTRVLESRELHRFLTQLNDQPISDDAKSALRVQLLTGLRVGEVLAMRWKDIDFRGRTIAHPAVIMKSGKAAETVMSDALRRLLLDWKRETASRGSDTVFREGLDTRALVDEMRRLKSWIAFGTHDIRRTVRTHLQELGCPEEIRSRMTNHAEPNSVSKHYDHAPQQTAQLEWLTRWADALDAVRRDPNALARGIEAGDDDPLLAEYRDVL